MLSTGPDQAPETRLTERRLDGGVGLVKVTGEIDVRTAGDLAEALDHAAGNGYRRLLVDLSGLDFIDSTGLHVLIRAREQLTAAGSRMVLVSDAERFLRILKVTGLDKVFEVAPSRGAALGV